MAERSELSTYRSENLSSWISETSNALNEESAMIHGLKLTFGWNRFNLRPIGLWPNQISKESQSNPLIRYVAPMCCIWVLVFTVIPQALAPISYPFVLRELIELISAVAGCTAAIVRIMVLWYNREVLANCLSVMADDWSRELSSEERETMMKNAKLGKEISIGVTIFVQCLVWSYVFLRALPLIYLNFDGQNATELGKQLFYPGYCPFDLSDKSIFVFIWSGQCIGLLCAGFAYSGTDGFVAMLIIHLCGQITILRYALINFIDVDTSMRPENFRVHFRELVKRHHTLIKMGDTIKEILSILLLVLILAYTLQICCQLFCLMAAVTERQPGQFPFLQVFFYLSFLVATFIHLFVYCYVGDMLLEESEALGLATYSSKWYNLSSGCANDLKFVMCRTRVPLKIWAGKFAPFSLRLFGNILKTSMSYFSVLLTVKEQSLD